MGRVRSDGNLGMVVSHNCTARKPNVSTAVCTLGKTSLILQAQLLIAMDPVQYNPMRIANWSTEEMTAALRTALSVANLEDVALPSTTPRYIMAAC